ncbi:hypothetical protein [Shewanella sp. SM74]|uniref:hypothetical protein n=1 Tax=Shewanella sp. SM74 TaxID=2912807 RepID=UPI0021DAD77F|nr:hypothetical protein [Shewanella sp. SM74]MCU8012523.1 hypothetical protein [Shewanella sp. SM74]
MSTRFLTTESQSQITPYAQELIDYVCKHGRMGELAAQMLLDDWLEPDWRQMTAPPTAECICIGIDINDFVDDDEEGADA